MNRIITFVLSLLLLQLTAIAKQDLAIRFSANWKQNNISVPKVLNSEELDVSQFHITKVRFYLSHVQLFFNGKCVYSDKAPGHLIDLSDSAKSELHLLVKSNTNYDEIRFIVGIDSATTMKGIEKGDLDPSNEMYWSWQSGFINFKLEGYSPLCTNERPKNEFHYHIGGYHFYENTCYPVSLNNLMQNHPIHITLQLDEILNDDLLKQVAHVQLPGKRASAIAKDFAKCFHSKQ